MSCRATEPSIRSAHKLEATPPGDGACEFELTKFRQAIADAFRQSDGVLEVRKETALFLSRKTD